MSDPNLSAGDKFAAANEQALAEWTNDGDDAVVETADEEPAEAVEESDEQQESTDEPADDDVENVVVEDRSATEFDPANWDGNMSSLPESHRKLVDPIYKTMERGMHAKFQELASLKKEYEAKLEKLHSDPTPKAKQAEVVPPIPTADLPSEVQEQMWNERDRYFARKAIEEMAPKADPRVNELLVERETAQRVQMVQSMEGYTPSVGQAMAQIAQSHPYYQSMLDSEEGMTVLFHTAKTALENLELKQATAGVQQAKATKAEAVIKKKASAGNGAVSRSSGTRKAAVSNVARSFEDANRLALEEWESRRD
jgi:hypothetical protein